MLKWKGVRVGDRWRSRRDERGVVMLVAAFAAAGLLAFAALAVDVGVMLNARQQLQHAADAASRAAVQELRESGSVQRARREARRYASANRLFNEPIRLRNSDVQVGNFDYATRSFAGGLGPGTPAVRVTAGATQGSRLGPLRLFFAPIVGMASVDVAASAVAALRRRDVVFTPDRSFEAQPVLDEEKDAGRELVRTMQLHGIPGDRAGVVSFARDTTVEQDLTDVHTGAVGNLLASINNLLACLVLGPIAGPCYGRDVGAGIDAARTMLENQSTTGDAERVIVLVLAGVPCFPEAVGNEVATAEQAAHAAADVADDAGISIFSLSVDDGPSSSHPCELADVTRNELLARGFGRGVTTDDADELDDLVEDILADMPVYLVE